MRYWLGNPIVVAALVLVAFFAVSRNIIMPAMQDHPARVPAMLPSLGDMPLIEVSSSMHSGVEWDQVGWVERIKRDPFRSLPAGKIVAK
ncbi:MAG: hypothetical protein R8K46_07580 [Mariprofundaceae bacterium]